MNFRNNGKGEDNILQNKFTKYLIISIHRKKTAFMQQRDKIIVHEQLLDSWERASLNIHEDMSDRSDLLENMDFIQALESISERDRTIFFAHVLDDRGFAELGSELGLGYKGAAAAYYRTIKKIKEGMRGEKDEF